MLHPPLGMQPEAGQSSMEVDQQQQQPGLSQASDSADSQPQSTLAQVCQALCIHYHILNHGYHPDNRLASCMATCTWQCCFPKLQPACGCVPCDSRSEQECCDACDA